ncbi:MAG: ArnT family glycosyltransferase [Ktedonobacteraceae bacterium]
MKWLRYHMIRYLLVLLALLLVLLGADALCYQVALPVEIDVQHGAAILHVGSESVALGTVGRPTQLVFAPHDPVIHEYQIDGTDSTNNYTLDPTYINSIATSPYYRFQAWMRDLEGTSRWRNAQVWVNGQEQQSVQWPDNGSSMALPAAQALRISVQLERPETLMTLYLLSADGGQVAITLDRNDRQIQVSRFIPGQSSYNSPTTTFFPIDVAPFAAMVIDTLIRITLWAVIVLLVVVIGEMGIGLFLARRGRLIVPTADLSARVNLTDEPVSEAKADKSAVGTINRPLQVGFRSSNAGMRFLRNRWQRLTGAIHPIALVALAGSLVFVAWIAAVQYNGEPHIYDASAYLFAAKMYALGHFSVPIPEAADRFPGPFMVQYNGQWFGQYAPGTALTLVPGIWLGVPWLVEPVLGTFALLGTGLIAARLYDRHVATVAVLLGTLSPFYSYLSASYLSHTVALCYFVWGTWALLRFAQGEASWNMPLAAVLFGMAGLTRDLVAVLYVGIVLPGIMLLVWRDVQQHWRLWVLPLVTFFSILFLFFMFNALFNALLTGDPLVTPRSLFFAGDHWGFGQGVGFYGQHTLAAGFVNIDELLTILQIDLFGWPFYLTLAFLAIPFLTRRFVGADWFMLAVAAIMTGAYVGYFYHGIYLGPRYLFETLPFLLILTARGLFTLAATAMDARQAISTWFMRRKGGTFIPSRPGVSIMTIALIVALLLCNILYYMPRQIALHQDFSGLPAGYAINLPEIYHPPLHNAIIVTGDYTIYQMVLFPLNDPLLHDDVLYAFASNSADYAELRSAFPGRTLYQLVIAPDGSVSYVSLKG